MSKKIVIVGGVAGGASTAARLRRRDEHAKIVLLESGPYISFANCGLPYYIGGVITDRDELLVMDEESFEDRFCVDVRPMNEARSIDRAKKTVQVLDKKTGETYNEPYDQLVLATGSAPLRPPVPGIDGERIFTLWNMEDTDILKAYIDETKPKKAVVVGGGFIGIEMAENLVHLGMDVTLVEMMPRCMAHLDHDMAEVLHEELLKNGVEPRLGRKVVRFSDDGGEKLVELDDGNKIPCDIVLLSMGVRPRSELAKEAGLSLNGRGGIVTDGMLRTSDENIYAVGDVIEVNHFVSGEKTMIPLAGPANKQGRLCADNLMGDGKTYAGTQGSSVAKVFDMTAASTGMNTEQIEAGGQVFGTDFFAVKTYAWSHATYYPGAERFAIKLLYTKEGKILGAQAVGEQGVDKRIDVIATAMRLGGTIYDLTALELCYAPPYSSAKDPVNMLGFMAENHLSGKVRFIHYNELGKLDPTKTIYLDVREGFEVEEGGIAQATHIPLGELRERMGELDKRKTIVVFCAIGHRANVASRILMQNGFDEVYVYAGGYSTYSQMADIVSGS
ncbi:MAG: FAD-dependent oxidoreductase [Christensenellaceae bacterium]